MNYSWQILKFSTRDQTNSEGVVLPNAVVKIKWKRSGTDADGNTASVLGYTTLTAENVGADSFVQFESLTEEMVVGWIESVITDAKMIEFNDKIQDKINAKSTTDRAVPWS